MKKLLQGTALTALAAAACVGVGSVDASAEIQASNITVDTEAQTVKVTTSDKEVLFGVGTYNKNKGTVKVSAWDVYKSGDSIDLSKLSNVKDNYIAVTSEVTKNPIYIRISSSVKSQKLKYNAAANTLDISKIKDANGDKAVTDYVWQYRTAYGNWTAIDGTNKGSENMTVPFGTYIQQGASLNIRAAATKVTNLAKIEGLKVKDASVQDAAEQDVYEGGSLPGKEAKLNIAKQANGPKVTVDYVKNTVTLPKGSEYRLIQKSSDTAYDAIPTGFTANSEKTVTDVSTLIEANKKGIIVEARKAADTEKGKAASKLGRVVLEAPAELPGKPSSVADLADKAKLAEIDSKQVTIEYTKKGNKDAIKIKNGTDKAINVIVQSSTDAPKADATWTTIKAGKEAINVANDGDSIFIRTAGDKKTTTLAGAAANVGKVKYVDATE